MATLKVIVVGAGMGGLSAAIDLARQGADVTVLERAEAPGGKMREILVDGEPIDAGPTVFTMRWIFSDLFEDAGASFEDALTLVPAGTLARHAWRQGGMLDLFANVERSADAIGDFAGADAARGYLRFCARSKEIYETLRPSFIAAERPNPLDLVRRVGLSNIGALMRTAPTKTMWSALGDYFKDPRLRQLFGRYATYTGCSPFEAPATLMLIAHVEQDGVWFVEGGMRRIADAMQALAERQGGSFRFTANVSEIVVERGRAAGVVLETGERLKADAVVFNGDTSALGQGLLGQNARRAAKSIATRDKSLSAITWCLKAETSGFPLEHHNVFFAEDYAEEFDAIFKRRTICDAPTVYICKQSPPSAPADRLLVLINAPAGLTDAQLDIEEMERRTFELLGSCGLEIKPDGAVITTPERFERLFPGSGGALYGRANHGAFTSFQRPGSASAVPGLYLAGGSVHPGAGIPMATMSGRLAAERVLKGWKRH
ncbi:MAG: 1-hydroxycarotenoid 3,4-desaturase CrtD [Pseudomonadota bacterium]